MNDNDIVKKCASCFVIDNNNILLIFHKKFGKYLQPGGHIEEDEEPYQAAMREVFEETGIEIIIDNKRPFNIEVYDTKIGGQLDYQFIGRPINKDIKKNEESYLCDWFNIDNLNNIDIVEDLKDKIKMIKSR